MENIFFCVAVKKCLKIRCKTIILFFFSGRVGQTDLKIWDFPGGAVDRNPPANARNMDLIPGLGRVHTS